MSCKIREMHPEEYPLLRDFLYMAIYLPEGVEPPPESILDSPALQVYIAQFGSSRHDKALVAELDGKIVGAVWSRIMNDYGHLMILLLPWRCQYVNPVGVKALGQHCCNICLYS